MARGDSASNTVPVTPWGSNWKKLSPTIVRPEASTAWRQSSRNASACVSKGSSAGQPYHSPSRWIPSIAFTLQELLPLGRLPDPGATVAKCDVPDESFDAFASRDRRCNRYNSRASARNRNVKLWHNGCASAIEFKTFALLSRRCAHHFPHRTPMPDSGSLHKPTAAVRDIDLANAIRALAMDAVEAAKSGHPGMPMGMAEIAVALWKRHLRHNPGNPAWPDRDRFVLSNGHGSMLLYSLLHLTGYDLPMAELKRFRQLGSKTPGHPEFGYTPGVETTTGPLGQGISNAVGMALAERLLAAEFNRPGHEIVDHFTYVFLGDGCLMEGISHEACSLAGTLGLGKLIAFYDDNGISIDGPVQGWFTDDTPKRFEAYGWHVVSKVDGHDPAAIEAALKAAQAVTDKPSLICCRTQIGK